MLQLVDMRAHVRHLVQDTDTALLAADIDTLINEAGNWWHTTYTDRVLRRSATLMFGSSFGSAVYFKSTLQVSDAKLLGMNLETGAGLTDGTPLEWKQPGDIYRMRLVSTATGTPRYWAAYREGGNSGRWVVLIHPASATGAPISAVVESQWTDLTDDTDTPDVGVEAAYAISRIAAVQCAPLLGRPPDIIAAIAQLIPEHVKARLGMLERQLQPRPPIEHVL